MNYKEAIKGISTKVKEAVFEAWRHPSNRDFHLAKGYDESEKIVEQYRNDIPQDLDLLFL